jgi:alcohol dehydrogenase class IV
MLPRVALIDPELTYSVPPELTATTGLDALAQLMEPYLSKQANPLTDAICLEGLRRAARSLRRCFEDGSDAAAREDMSLASLFSGLALANAKLGAIHGLAAPLGGLLSAPHGAICARLLPAVMEVNLRALNSRGADSPALSRYDTVARILTQKPTAQAADGVAWVQELCACLKVASLSELGLQETDFPNLVREAQRASSTKGNPVELTDKELTEVLSQTL